MTTHVDTCWENLVSPVPRSANGRSLPTNAANPKHTIKAGSTFPCLANTTPSRITCRAAGSTPCNRLVQQVYVSATGHRQCDLDLRPHSFGHLLQLHHLLEGEVFDEVSSLPGVESCEEVRIQQDAFGDRGTIGREARGGRDRHPGLRFRARRPAGNRNLTPVLGKGPGENLQQRGSSAAILSQRPTICPGGSRRARCSSARLAP